MHAFNVMWVELILSCSLAQRFKAAAARRRVDPPNASAINDLTIMEVKRDSVKFYEQGRSQPNLPQRIWGSSDLSANVSRSRSLSSSNRGYRPGSSVRPLPTIYSRPESRAADSRPQSRVEPRDQEKALDRPVSGVRPLSGRVFMRRSSERGWIAKAYPDAFQATSQTELELMEDDISDCDSFFDDDFDMETKDEKLGMLLSCNTLGVESKGRRPDWIAGEVEIPTFHCPRCRDHWYGLTDEPCDEELARLRREGLWPLGKDGGDKRLNMHGGGKTLRPVSSRREYNALSSGSSAVKLPKLRRKKDGEDGDKSSRGAGSQTELNKKKKKRISFKLGDDSQAGSSEPSGVSLDGDDPLGGRGRRSKDKSESGGGLGDGLGDSTGKGEGGRFNRRRGVGDGMGAGDGEEGVSSSRGGLGEDGGDRLRNRQGLMMGDDGGIGSDRSGRQLNGEDSDDAFRRKGLKGLQDNGKGSGRNDGSDGKFGAQNSRLTAGLGSLGAGDDGIGAGGIGRSSLGQSGTTSNGGIKSGLGTLGGSGDGTGIGHGKLAEGGKNRNASGDLTSSSQVSRAGSSKSGSRRGSLAMSDHGKSVRKSVGYMRAVSPTSSEWGDPHHGRSFISSTATSRTGSTSNLLRDLEREKDDEPTSKSLPAIVPQIKKKQPLMDFSDLMGGFQLTRAWTFSYHNKM